MNVVGFEADDPADVRRDRAGRQRRRSPTSRPTTSTSRPARWADWGRCFDICPLASSPALRGVRHHAACSTSSSTGTEATYVGSGEVEGSVADRWAMDEYDGVLRLAVGPTQATGNFNSVVTLERRGDELVEIGRLDKLGVNEDIESVRWFDGLAIVVTFRQIDPLYAIDLSDQDDPRLMGEAEDPRLLRVPAPARRAAAGRHRPGPDAASGGWGAQVGLFNVTDLTNPRRIDVLHYAPGTEALAGADPRQFTWLPDGAHPAHRDLEGLERPHRLGLGASRSTTASCTNRMVEAEYGDDVDQVRAVPLPDGRVVLVTGDDVEFFDLRDRSYERCRAVERRDVRSEACAATSAGSTTSSRPRRKDEVHAAALQYVRKVSGTTKPSQANQEAFDRAVHEVAHVTATCSTALVTTAPPKDREVEAEKARARAALRYGTPGDAAAARPARRPARSSSSPAPGCPPTPASPTTAARDRRRGRR